MRQWWKPLAVVVVVVVVVVVAEVAGTGPPSDFVGHLDRLEYLDANYYSANRNGYTGTLDDLRRGHDGLIVKLNDVIKTLKGDELKLNNVFYKLGRHDTDLEGMDGNLRHLTESSRRIEAKLNKHAYSVDFLRRQMEGLQRRREGEAGVKVEVATVRSIIDRLDDRLTDALARLGLVENTTKTLEKRSAPGGHPEVIYSDDHLGFIQAAERPPTLTVYPQPWRESCRLDYERVGNDCYWIGGEELTFIEATSTCLHRGGGLLTLPAPGTQLNLLLARLNKDTFYWTGATDAFSHGSWVYLMTAQPVMPLHWFGGNETHNNVPNNPFGPHTHHCAGLTQHGLEPRPCTQRHPYICQVV